MARGRLTCIRDDHRTTGQVATMSRKRVVIVEDHGPTCDTLRRIFTRQGWDACTATTMVEGLTCLDPPPDCVVLDLMLPDGEGEAILRKIRADSIPTRVV